MLKYSKITVWFVYFFQLLKISNNWEHFCWLINKESIFSAKIKHKKIDSWYFVKKNLRSWNFGGLDATNNLFIRQTHSVIHGCQPSNRLCHTYGRNYEFPMIHERHISITLTMQLWNWIVLWLMNGEFNVCSPFFWREIFAFIYEKTLLLQWMFLKTHAQA